MLPTDATSGTIPELSGLVKLDGAAPSRSPLVPPLGAERGIRPRFGGLIARCNRHACEAPLNPLVSNPEPSNGSPPIDDSADEIDGRKPLEWRVRLPALRAAICSETGSH